MLNLAKLGLTSVTGKQAPQILGFGASRAGALINASKEVLPDAKKTVVSASSQFVDPALTGLSRTTAENLVAAMEKPVHIITVERKHPPLETVKPGKRLAVTA